MKKNKVINLFGDQKTDQNKEVAYATLLEKFIKPFDHKFKDFEYHEDVYGFAQNTWNLGNMRSILEKSEFENIISSSKEDGEDYLLLEKMTSNKVTHFKEFTDFIVDIQFFEKNGNPTLKVTTKSEDDYLSDILQMDFPKDTQDDFEENFINRFAISLKPLQPFIDWHNTIYPDTTIDESDLDEVNIYLINNSNFSDIKTHLEKRFDRYFTMELNGWHTNEKQWPKKRNYKMFKKWFRVDISSAIYDLEKTPVSKTY